MKTLTLAVFEDKHLLYWDQGNIAEMNEMFNEFYDEYKDTWQEDRQRNIVTGYTIWKGGRK
ncbi:hypothetical protein KM868_11920 [Micrococcus luteus]|uniref:hypothetical protein n=1 Tax=Micrococcus luteus TaxID=1270 RepID=UPI001C244244|nr:hypothetical protein [Micrococcus luteus]MBU8764199.1 hypothetical protein [Micrococcus luteus]